MKRIYKETYPIVQQQFENMRIKSRNVFQVPTTPLFHYTSREVFWKIIEEESFLARHILFSNDFEEYELGRNKVEAALGNYNDEELSDANERYMVCFCEEGDLLSQWRGYAQNGIAMEFDFSLGIDMLSGEKFSPYHCFTIVNGGKIPEKAEVGDKMNDVDKESELFEKRYVSFDKENKDKYLTLCLTAPYRVFYVNKNEDNEALSRAIENVVQDDDAGGKAAKLIPYIKNDKFEEEKEYRLIFNLTDLYKPGWEYFRQEKNVYLDVAGVKKPNIRVEFGNARDTQELDIITLYYRNTKYQPSLEAFAKEWKLSKTAGEVRLHQVTSTLKEHEILLSNGREQEKVMLKLTQWVLFEKDVFSKVKVWCDGHLPIRKIIVGPSKDAELMQKSIEQYIKNKYWLRFVDVDTSEIPYRN